MATTFSYDVSSYKRADGMYLVKIRMTHNRVSLRKPSKVYVNRTQLSRDGKKIRDASVLNLIDNQLRKLRDIVEHIEGSEFYDADRLWAKIEEQLREGNSFKLDIFEYAEKKMSTMEKKTAEGYKSSLNAFRRFLGKDWCDINDIDYKMMLSFREYLENEPALKDGRGKHLEKKKGCRAVSSYLTCLRALHNSAKREYNDDDVVRIPKQPFKEGLIPPQPMTEHRSLSKNQIVSIMNVELVEGSRADLSRDVFIMSFFLIGMNTVDIYNLKKKDLKYGIITYNRAKTDSVRKDNAKMKVRVEKELSSYMNKYSIPDKRFGDDEHLFSFAERYSDYRGFNTAVNKGLKEVGVKVGIDGLTTYHARHTWATMARNECCIDFYSVHEALNHAKRGGDRVTDIYIERDWSNIWEANRRVIDFVFK